LAGTGLHLPNHVLDRIGRKHAGNEEDERDANPDRQQVGEKSLAEIPAEFQR
jgi:hypothetical protein